MISDYYAILGIKKTASIDDIQTAFRNIAKKYHPDVNKCPDAELKFKLANEAYTVLSDLEKRRKYDSGYADLVIGKWSITKPLVGGALCDLYLATQSADICVFKIITNATDNELMDREKESLSLLHTDTKPGSDTFKLYIPKLIDSMEASYRRANVLTFAENYIPLSSIHSMFPTGIPFRHVVWMMNRVLDVLGFSHQNGIIHGAVLPNHLLYNPETHGLVLVDWTASVKFPSDDHIPLVVSKYKSHYPLEVFRKDAYKSTDIYMAAKTLRSVVGVVPARFRGFFEWCLAESPAARPEDAWSLQDKWKKLAQEEYGKPTFVKLDIPVH